jgi:hypothetical protein
VEVSVQLRKAIADAIWSLPVLVTASLAIAGCGSASQPDRSPESQVRRDVAWICEQATRRVSGGIGPGTSTFDVANVIIAARTEALSSLAAVSFPPTLAEQKDRLATALRSRNEAQKTFVAALRAGAPSGYETAERTMNHQLAVADDALRRLRISGCPYL